MGLSKFSVVKLVGINFLIVLLYSFLFMGSVAMSSPWFFILVTCVPWCCCYCFVLVSQVRDDVSENISCWTGLPAMNFISISFCVSEKAFIFASPLKDNFAGYRTKFNLMYVNRMNPTYAWFLCGGGLNWIDFSLLEWKCFWTGSLWIKFYLIKNA